MNQIKILNRYIMWHLLQATAIVSLILIGIVFLTQSVRFLELVVESGASSGAFWFLTLLALPRFFELIVPIALLISVIFIYHKLLSDSELIVMKSAGLSPVQLARPALVFISLVIVFLYIMAFWAGPKSASAMQHYRQIIKSSATQFFFREGVFNSIGDGLMFYIREKSGQGGLYGLMIHDSRGLEEDERPVTIMAERGQILYDSDVGRQVVVYDGQRQQYNPQTQILDKLAFDKYTIEVPQEEKDIRDRWAEPDERSLWQLIFPKDLDNPATQRLRVQLIAEANRRITGPLLSLTFAAVALSFLLLGPLTRDGYLKRIFIISAICIVTQSLFLVAYDIAKSSYAGNILLYLIVFGPICGALFYLRRYNIAYHKVTSGLDMKAANTQPPRSREKKNS